ncbi:MAG: hypothetical protein FWG53_02680, partial [Clostridiales bacterium]|nr:hypothetical protein [Clostridiales bacterium]
MLDRKRIFNTLYNFVRTADIKYHAITVEKKHLSEKIDLMELTKILVSVFSALMKNIEFRKISPY